LRVLVRNRWVAAALFVVIFSAPKILGSDHVVLEAIVWVTVYGIAAFAVVRFGLIVLGTATFMANTLLNVPYTLDFSNWYAAHCLLIVVTFVAVAVWGLYNALAGQKLWKDELLD
jgi:hypothetical protein